MVLFSKQMFPVIYWEVKLLIGRENPWLRAILLSWLKTQTLDAAIDSKGGHFQEEVEGYCVLFLCWGMVERGWVGWEQWMDLFLKIMKLMQNPFNSSFGLYLLLSKGLPHHLCLLQQLTVGELSLGLPDLLTPPLFASIHAVECGSLPHAASVQIRLKALKLVPFQKIGTWPPRSWREVQMWWATKSYICVSAALVLVRILIWGPPKGLGKEQDGDSQNHVQFQDRTGSESMWVTWPNSF